MLILIFSLYFPLFSLEKQTLPQGFVYLSDIDSTIIQDLIYSTSNNIIGRPLQKYELNECILTESAAKNLTLAQTELLDFSRTKLKEMLSLKVFDCYRPVDAQKELYSYFFSNNYSKKMEYFPRLSKYEIISKKYIRENSSYSRGSTVSVTITSYQSHKYHSKVKRKNCHELYEESVDGNLNVGVLIDCFDTVAEFEKILNSGAFANRKLLDALMNRFHFSRKGKLMWEFTLENEKFPNDYFNFPVK